MTDTTVRHPIDERARALYRKWSALREKHVEREVGAGLLRQAAALGVAPECADFFRFLFWWPEIWLRPEDQAARAALEAEADEIVGSPAEVADPRVAAAVWRAGDVLRRWAGSKLALAELEGGIFRGRGSTMLEEGLAKRGGRPTASSTGAAAMVFDAALVIAGAKPGPERLRLAYRMAVLVAPPPGSPKRGGDAARYVKDLTKSPTALRLQVKRLGFAFVSFYISYCKAIEDGTSPVESLADPALTWFAVHLGLGYWTLESAGGNSPGGLPRKK